MDSRWSTPHTRQRFPSQGNWVTRIISSSCKSPFGNTELLTVLSVPREENPRQMASEKPCIFKTRYPPGTIINAGGIAAIYLFIYFQDAWKEFGVARGH